MICIFNLLTRIAILWNINVIYLSYVNPNNTSDEKENLDEKTKQQAQTQPKEKLGNKKEFDLKMKKIANNEDYEWIAAIMDIDEFDSFVFENNNNKQIIENEMGKLEKQIIHLFNIYGNNNDHDSNKYFVCKLSDSGHFGLILYDSKDLNKCLVPAHEILETLKEEIGSSELIEDDLGMSDYRQQPQQQTITTITAAISGGFDMKRVLFDT